MRIEINSESIKTYLVIAYTIFYAFFTSISFIIYLPEIFDLATFLSVLLMVFQTTINISFSKIRYEQLKKNLSKRDQQKKVIKKPEVKESGNKQM
ncbi:MAG: hypothetical protein QXP04_02820 [Candidatus Nanoarchaeia archaeon]|nr:hypothetical protein [Candidatus Jingweiarchaeum tengchongense]